VSGQHAFSQARKATILTALASIFIPISFVAVRTCIVLSHHAFAEYFQTFFGMNTQEINSSALPLKYYFAAALPLAVITIIVPLYFIDTVALLARMITYLSRKIQEPSVYMLCVGQFALGLTLAMEIWRYASRPGLDTLALFDIYCLVYFSMLMVASIVVAFNFVRRIRITNPDVGMICCKIWNQRLMMSKFFLGVSYFISFSCQEPVDIPFYFIYYILLFLHLRRRRRAKKAALVL
jgi:hypothetical protein